ncbi:hypothetical protein N0V90_001846 [Kalmusia sp. IMI 367209]|nr:hypothetical protein N0V90_001846 [Kalmusia sp. IMI 367209]
MTKRPEDKVYALLGIFDIHMEVIYGEGEHHATRRLLRELGRYSENHQLSDIFRNQLQLSSAEPPRTPLVNPTWIVPFERNSRFTSRDLELARLEEMLFGEHHTAKLAITGLGGVGKTQLVIELLYRVADKHKNCAVIWISAVNMEILQQSYLDVARQLCIPGCEDDKTDVKRLVQEHLSKLSTGQWLLVFDNADDIDMWIAKSGPKLQPGQGSPPLNEYLPKSKQGNVIFTTRDMKIAVKLAQQNIVSVPEMGEEAAAQMLEKCLVNPDLAESQQETSALLLQLTYLPLAIVQAAAYINENAISLADYLSLLAEQEEEVVDLLSEEFEDDGRYPSIKNPIATTWLISFEQIQQRDQLAAEYLSFMACVEPKNIPQSLLPPGLTRKKEIDAIGTLKAYSFIVRRPADTTLNLHRLVHLATRNWLRKEGQLIQSTEKAIMRLERVFPNNSHENRTLWRSYLTHVRCVLESDLVEEDWKTRMDLMWRYAICLHEDGRWDEAEIFITKVVDKEKRMLGPEHPDMLVSISNLALTYHEQGRWKEAEELAVQVMETRKRVLGVEHPDTLISIGNLALTYHKQGRWKEAEELGVQVMETRKRVLGVEHPDTLISISNLASTYNAQGRLKEAEELKVQVMETRKRVLGVEHPDTLISIGNLASTYQEQGRWKEAEELGVQVIETRKRVLGVEHPDTLISIGNLSLTYYEQGRWKEAEELGVQVIEMRKRVLGVEHPDTLVSIGNLSLTYYEQGRWKEAEELGVQVIETRKRVLGPKHPDTLISMNNLSYTWKAMGQREKALELMDECVQLEEQALGVNHPFFLSSSTWLNKWRLEDEG